jgi:hypothetical protein
MNPLVDKALQAHQQAENLKNDAIQSLLKERATIGDQLKALGYQEGQKPAKKAPSDPTKPKNCPTCGSTEHDGRFHRRKDATPPAPKSAPPKPSAPAAQK